MRTIGITSILGCLFGSCFRPGTDRIEFRQSNLVSKLVSSHFLSTVLNFVSIQNLYCEENPSDKRMPYSYTNKPRCMCRERQDRN